MGLGSAKEISFLNSADVMKAHTQDFTTNKRTSFVFTLSNRIVKQKRVVYDLFMMLGDVGGLSDIIIGICLTLVSVVNEPFMTSKLIQKLYKKPQNQIRNR